MKEKAKKKTIKKLLHKRQKSALICVLVMFSIFASFYFDNTLIGQVALLRNSVLDTFFLWVTFVSSEIIIFFVITALFLWKDHKRAWILPLWVSFVASTIITFILKVTIQRWRPFQLGLISLLSSLKDSYSAWNFSFPSNHAMLAFCAIPILSKHYPKLKKVWIAIAVIIALSRVYLGLHFFSDIIAGAFMGYLIGTVIEKEESERKLGEKIYQKIRERFRKR